MRKSLARAGGYFACWLFFSQMVCAASLFDSHFKAIDDNGNVQDISAYKGKAMMVTMEYSDCRYICSTTTYRLKQLQDAADARHQSYTFLIISLDPVNDTPAAWTRYRKARGLMRDNWHFLTPSQQDMPQIARILGIRYWMMYDHLLHDYKVIRFDPDGSQRAVLNDAGADPAVLLK